MQRLKFVTFNIAHARGLSPLQGISSTRKVKANLTKIAKMLTALDPDIIALQEIDENSRWSGSFNHLEFLREKTGFQHAVFGINNRRAGRFHLSYGNALLSRHPIVTSEAVTFGKAQVGEKGFLFAEIDLGARVLPVVNLHLNFHSRVRRLGEIEKVMAYLNEKHSERGKVWCVPPIICGDLNNPSHTKDATSHLFQYMSKHGAYSLHPDNARTFPSAWPSRALDFIFLPPLCSEASSQVIRSYLSDHRPVFLEFTLPAPR